MGTAVKHLEDWLLGMAARFSGRLNVVDLHTMDGRDKGRVTGQTFAKGKEKEIVLALHKRAIEEARALQETGTTDRERFGFKLFALDADGEALDRFTFCVDLPPGGGPHRSDADQSQMVVDLHEKLIDASRTSLEASDMISRSLKSENDRLVKRLEAYEGRHDEQFTKTLEIEGRLIEAKRGDRKERRKAQLIEQFAPVVKRLLDGYLAANGIALPSPSVPMMLPAGASTAASPTNGVGNQSGAANGTSARPPAITGGRLMEIVNDLDNRLRRIEAGARRLAPAFFPDDVPAPVVVFEQNPSPTTALAPELSPQHDAIVDDEDEAAPPRAKSPMKPRGRKKS